MRRGGNLNNNVVIWRLGASDSLELPPLAVSSMMKTAPIAGKT